MNQYFINSLKDIFLYSNEYLRIWKIAYLIIGISFLMVGSFLANMPDWDMGISLIMALMTYFLSPISGSIFLSLHYKKIDKFKVFYICVALIFWVLSVDFSYVFYNQHFHHPYYRATNFFASTFLYLICSLILSFRGTLKEFLTTLNNP